MFLYKLLIYREISIDTWSIQMDVTPRNMSGSKSLIRSIGRTFTQFHFHRF